MRRSLLLPAVLLCAACMDELPTAVHDVPEPPALSMENAVALQVAYVDALERVLPALRPAAPALRTELETLAAALESAPARALESMLVRATSALDALAPMDANTMTIALLIERTRTLAQPQAAPITED